MRPWLGAILGLALFAPFGAAQEQPKSEPSKGDDRQQQVKDLKLAYAKAANAYTLALRTAKTNEDKAAAVKLIPSAAEYLTKALKIVSEDPKDDAGFEALRFAFVSLTRGSNPRIVDLLAEHHAKRPEMKTICQSMLTLPPPGAGPLLRKVFEENPDREARGYACYALGSLAGRKADQGDATAADEAEKRFAQAIKEFGDVPMGKRGTIADVGKNALYEARELRIGKTAPQVESEDLKGTKGRLADYRGKVVVLDFWATWCGPCRAMIPHEREMVAKLKEQPFALISISADEKRDTLEKFLAKEEMPWVHWWESNDGPLLRGWNIRFFPTLYVLDAKGVIRHKNIRGQQLEEAVEKLLAEAK